MFQSRNKIGKNPPTSGRQEQWYDHECRKIKNSIKKKCKKIRKRNDNENLQREILAENKLLKNLIKKKKSEYKLKIMNDMKMNKKDQKNFLEVARET